jgi:hypothetical protein
MKIRLAPKLYPALRLVPVSAPTAPLLHQPNSPGADSARRNRTFVWARRQTSAVNQFIPPRHFGSECTKRFQSVHPLTT